VSRTEISLHKKRPNPATFYSEKFKKKVIMKYLEADFTKRELIDKHGIKAHSAIQEWMRKFGYLPVYTLLLKPLWL
jgi:transposase-like protein